MQRSENQHHTSEGTTNTVNNLKNRLQQMLFQGDGTVPSFLLLACLLLVALNTSAEEAYELNTRADFVSEGQNIWKPTPNDNFFEDGAAFDRVEETLFKLNILDIQTPEIGAADYEGLDALNTYSLQYSGATRVKDVDLACDDEAGEYLWLDGCYTCPNGGALDLILSGVEGPTCIDFKAANQVASPSIDGCPAGYDRDLVRNQCFEVCDSGYSYDNIDGKCKENLVVPELENKSCQDGKLHLGQCKSCPSGYSLNALGICTRATSKTTMSYCGKRWWDSCDTKVLGICVGGWDYSTKNCNSTKIRRSNNYYDCPNGYKHDILVSYNKTGICYKTYADKSPTIEAAPSCPSGSLDIGVSCVSCPADAPYNSATGQCGGRSYNPDLEQAVAWGCSTGTYDLDGGAFPGTCLSCSSGFDYNSKLGRDNCKRKTAADFAGVPAPDLSCPKGTFYDLFNGSPGCYACPDQMDRTLLPIDSPAACFGLAEGDNGGDVTVDLGIQIDAEFALRFAVSGEVVLDGGSVDIDLSTKPKLKVTRVGDSNSYQVTTSLDENFTTLTMDSTWPTMDGYIDTHTESYSYLSTKFGVVGFDDETGLPTNDVFTEVLIDSKTGDPSDPDAERYYGREDVATDRRHLYHAHVGYDPAIGGYDRYTRWTLPELFDFSLPFDFDIDFGFDLPDYLQDVTSSFAVPAKPGIKCPSPCLKYVLAEGWVNETNLNSPPDPGFNAHWDQRVVKSPRGDGISIRQELGRRPTEPLTGFDVPPPQTVDFTRIDLDLDGIVSKLTFPSTPLGMQVEFKKLGKKLLVLDGSQLDIDAALLISAEKNLDFKPNMDFVMTFSRPVEITDSHGTYTASRVQMPVGENFTFDRINTDELDIDVSYTVARNQFTNDTNLNALPLIEGEIFSLGWQFVVETPGLPNKWTLLTIPFELSDPLPILNVDEVKDDGVPGQARFTLGGFNDVEAGTLTLPALNATPVAVCRDGAVKLDNTGNYTIDPTEIDGGSSDSDIGDVLTFTTIPASLSCSDVGLKGVALTVTDQNGAEATCVATINVSADEIALNLTTPPAMEAVSLEGAPYDLEYSTSGGCGAVSLDVSPLLDEYPLGTTEVTVTATDAAGEVKSGSISVKVVDTTPPVFQGLPLPLLTPEAEGAMTAYDLTAPTADDLFGIQSLTNNAPAGGYPVGQPVEVTWTAVDNNGNTATATQVVEARDTTRPVLMVPADLTIEATALLTVVDPGAATATDIFDVSISNDLASRYPDGLPVGEATVTWTATDANGNVATATQLITVEDTTPPELIVNDIEVYEANAISSELALRPPAATDIFEVIITQDGPATFPLGETVINWTATDANGNSSSAAQTISVEDTTSPTLNVPGDLTVEANAVITVVAPGEATATDIFEVSISNDLASRYPDGLPVGETTVTWTAIDANGNETSETQLITVEDTTAPELTVSENEVYEANAVSSDLVLREPTATDIFEVAITRDGPATFELGETAIVWTATDANGNASSASQTVKVEDTTLPEISAPADITFEANGAETTISSIGSAQATDIFLSSVTNDAPATYLLGVTTVTWTATDTSGNQSDDSQSITVIDTTPPALAVPASIRAEGTETGGATITLPAATATDIVDAAPVIDCDAESGFFPIGTTPVTCTATDFEGNVTSGSFTVTVVDTTAPTLSVTPSTTLLSPPNHKYVTTGISVTAGDIVDDDLSIMAIAVSSEVDNADNDGNTTGDVLVLTASGEQRASSNGAPVVSFDPTTDTLSLRAERNSEGSGRVYSVEVTVSDDAGNTTSQSFSVLVPVGQSGSDDAEDDNNDNGKGKGKGKG